MKQLVAYFILGAAVASALAACSSTLQDLEGVRAETPQTLRVFYNIDRHPNVAVICEENEAGQVAGVFTTTRDYNAITEMSPQSAQVWCNGEVMAEVVPEEPQ